MLLQYPMFDVAKSVWAMRCSIILLLVSCIAYSDAHPGEDSWRLSLPAKLRGTQGAPLHRVIIQPQRWSTSCSGNVTVYLLGTSHVSRTSCEDAQLLMDHVRPDCLFVELCSQRVGLLLPPHQTTTTTSSEETNSVQQHQQQQHGMSPISQKSAILFAKIQSDYASKLNVTIGGEFKAAFQSALCQQREFWNSRQSSNYYVNSKVHPRANRPCAIVLGDRPVRITLLRAWESLRIFGKMKLVLALLWSSIRQPSEKELREWMESVLNDRTGKSDLMKKAMDELAKSFPTLKRVIIDERDDFMVAKIKQTAEMLAYNGSNDIGDERVMVAVIGAGHCSGILTKLLDTTSGQIPEKVLASMTKTKRTQTDDIEGTDVVQFDYAYAIETGMIHT